MPGTSPALIDQLGHLADRMSVNMELPVEQSLPLLAPDKSKQHILAPMQQIKENIAEDKDTRAISARSTTYMTQMRTKKKARAVRASRAEHADDHRRHAPKAITRSCNLSAALYRTLSLKRVFFSAYLPVNEDARLPAARRRSQLQSRAPAVPGRLASALLPDST